jgi:hypothetical protein
VKLYKRGDVWWIQHQGKRVSTHCSDKVAAELWAMTYERGEAVLRILDHDPELAERVAKVLNARRDARQQGMIYGITDGELVKVGFTSREPVLRLRQVQTHLGSKVKLVALVRGTRADEKRLHREFTEERVHGEWFRGPLVQGWVEQNLCTQLVRIGGTNAKSA